MKTPDEPENTEYELITNQNHVLRPHIDEVRRRVYNNYQWTNWSPWYKTLASQTVQKYTEIQYPPIVEWEFRKPKEKQTVQTTNDTDPNIPPKPLIFPEELEHAGITLKSHWPTPKIILNEPGAKFVLSYIENYAEHEHAAPIFIDVYIYQKDGRQSLVFADKITTKHDTYGSCDLMVFLDTINNGRANHPWRTIMLGMLSLGLFQFKDYT